MQSILHFRAKFFSLNSTSNFFDNIFCTRYPGRTSYAPRFTLSFTKYTD